MFSFMCEYKMQGKTIWMYTGGWGWGNGEKIVQAVQTSYNRNKF